MFHKGLWGHMMAEDLKQWFLLWLISIRNICGMGSVKRSLRMGSWHSKMAYYHSHEGGNGARMFQLADPSHCLLKRLLWFFQLGCRSDAPKGKAKYKMKTKHFSHVPKCKKSVSFLEWILIKDSCSGDCKCWNDLNCCGFWETLCAWLSIWYLNLKSLRICAWIAIG